MGSNPDEYKDGQTPIDDDEQEGLLIATITTRGELDEFEQQNIEQAILWSLSRSFKAATLFTEDFIKSLHKRMYGDVWAWAGHFRKTNTNIGTDKWQIQVELRMLLDDVRFWYTAETYSPDEFALRFKHRLVSIHCFPNGNGRHSRLLADIVITQLFLLPHYSWGAGISSQTEQRRRYLEAMRAADTGNLQPLMTFARS